MKDTYTLAEVTALVDAAMKVARKTERQWDQNAAEARWNSRDSYNTEYVKGTAQGYGMALNDFERAFAAALKEQTE